MQKKRNTYSLRKLIIAIMLGVFAFPIISFVTNLFPKTTVDNKIRITYQAASNEPAKLGIKNYNSAEYNSCSVVNVDSSGGDEKTITYSLNGVASFQKIKIVFDSNLRKVVVSSIEVRNNRHVITLTPYELFPLFKKHENTGLSYSSEGITIKNKLNTIKLTHNGEINLLNQLFEKVNFRFSIILASIVVIVLFLFPFTFFEKSRLHTVAFSLFFFTICFTPLLMNRKSVISFEKKLQLEKPRFTWANLFDYHRVYGEYFDDNFGFRAALIKFHNKLKVSIFKESPMPERLMIGRDNWLFFKGMAVMDITLNRNLYSIQDLETIRKNLELKQNWLKARGIEFYLFITPIKSKVYPENLPNYLPRVNRQSKTEQLIDYLKQYSSIKIVYPAEQLRTAKQEQQVYYSNDTHWNFFGAFIAYKELIKKIQPDFPDLKEPMITDYSFRESYRFGDLGQLLGLSNYFLSKESKPVPILPSSHTINIFNLEVEDSDMVNPPILTENSDTTMPEVLFFRDSYSNFYINYAGESFSRCLFLWTHKFKPVIIETQNPDIVVHEILERFIDELLIEPSI